MNILAIDPGTEMGVSSFVDGEIRVGLLKWKTHKKEFGDIILDFAKWLRFTIKECRIEKIWYEKPHAGPFFFPQRMLFGLMAVIESEAREANIPVQMVSPKAIKLFWTGSGGATKSDMLKATVERKRLSVVYRDTNGLLENHNTNDAFALLHYALEKK